jgi:hypothetical protein
MAKTNVTVKLVGEDGNAFNILGKVNSALKKNGFYKEASEFMAEATKGDYNHLLKTACDYVEVI